MIYYTEESDAFRLTRRFYNFMCLLLGFAGFFSFLIWQDVQNGRLNEKTITVESATDNHSGTEPTHAPKKAGGHLSTETQENDNPGMAPHQIPHYKLTPIDPMPPNGGAYSIIMDYCYRDGGDIHCQGHAENDSDNTEAGLLIYYGNATDSEGNTSGFSAMLAGTTQLFPNTPTKFGVNFHDPHTAAQWITVQLRINFRHDGHDHEATPVFSKIPIQ